MNFKNNLFVFTQTRPRLILAVLAGLICFVFLPKELSALSRGIVSWNVLAWFYLMTLWWLMLRADPQHIRKIARIQDESAFLVLILVCVGSIVSLLAILLEISSVNQLRSLEKTFSIALTFFTLAASWLLLPTAFALHYAHIFYLSGVGAKPLLFPDHPPEPSYWDFLYFSFTIAVASQTADVAIASPKVRQIALLQSVLSFLFNMSILGLSINVGAGLLG
ncbi:DUF1345 domain-containing protein [Iodobacter sp. CM08]|uniref:DUF1345 domain-containing protein n=1 Tax=Iodobacter sp. CM08 TaxID=3085902 RepID=UPI002980D25F|nr:DUF1345 domain-containing protein [Iodobacter sp. CM08]MDW5418235.1 DUF1345 domain-containing protein [Iodobacter sp. CM08]